MQCSASAALCRLQAALEAMSALHSGRPKAEDHRQALAAAQRRRHAATRVLRAIEEVQCVQKYRHPLLQSPCQG